MPEIDEFEELANKCGWDISNFLQPGDPKNKDFIEADISKIIKALRKVAEKYERIGYNKAVEEAAQYCESYPFPAELERKCGCIPSTEYAKVIRRLKKG